MTQSKKASAVEALTNTAVGFGLSLATNILIFPLYGIPVHLGSSIAITLWFTIISVIRSYVLRRIFNKVRNAEGST